MVILKHEEFAFCMLIKQEVLTPTVRNSFQKKKKKDCFYLLKDYDYK